ncbi:alpha-amylase family glycosyl hydrolase [uncultured Desulfosarcina sp.]|uniref:alpha-amylase family glycosyl hydrolase n=1 Tax=uncultured Desulfosarcina sp. TaxID=218289 RepID=UPI0029C60B79|nr:alpha-amylase family glycosyl hydrolase [uncultured Desulfosarcina sp.]
MKSILHRIYGREKGDRAFARLSAVLDAFAFESSSGEKDLFSEADTVLITYGDSLLRNGEQPLQTLHRFAGDHFKEVFSGIHILPFFPYSSDDGFSVEDFHTVRSDLGSWKDIQAVGHDFRLMVDLVANHVSAQSRWFQSYLANQKGFGQLAIEVDPAADLSGVTRPRALPLLTAFEKRSGRRVHLWTTFSADQIDLNYRSLDVLENMVRTLLFYASKKARIIRLDAIAYLWKQIGTPCIHLPQTHDMVRLFRRILDLTAPGVTLVTETNVPHAENISYFGNGADEAQMVYNFSLPPLLLYSLATGSARIFSDWARNLKILTERTTFFNFTASHDGIGMRPLEGILPSSQIAWLANRVILNGGLVSERRNPDGSNSPYELNITYLDALKDPASPEDPMHIPRFLASQAVALALAGVPGVYIHSLLGSQNWTEGVRLTGRARTINRERLSVEAVGKELADRRSLRSRIFYPYQKMIRIRIRQPAFHPAAGMRILNLDDRVFAVKRFCPKQTLVAMTNFSAHPLTVTLPAGKESSPLSDLFNGVRFGSGSIPLAAYQTAWLVRHSTIH